MKEFIVRSMFFLLITVLWYTGLFWLSLPLCAWYCYRYDGFELIVLGVCIDVQFQVYGGWPFYTTASFVVVFLLQWLRPRLSVYTGAI